MRRFLFLILLLPLLSHLKLEARSEVIVTIPKSGTNYMNRIMESLLGVQVAHPRSPYYSQQMYQQFNRASDVLVLWHAEPLAYHLIPSNCPILLLIRDPRDVVLSAIDFIDKHKSWPGLENFHHKWKQLKDRKAKAELLINNSYDKRGFAITNLFETAKKLTSRNDCLIIKYEQINPRSHQMQETLGAIKDIGRFFNISLSDERAAAIIKTSFRNPKSWSLNKASPYRYLEEDEDMIEFLTSKLEHYIEYFGYSKDYTPKTRPL